MRIVFIGPPGAGKGTQASRLAKHLEIPHLSTGEILRSAKQSGTELGKKVAPIMDSGGLVSDELMQQVVEERLQAADCQPGYLLDGFPRTMPQVRSFAAFLDQQQIQLDHVIEIQVSDEELKTRLQKRFHQVDQPRPEDTPEAIDHRLVVYHELTEPILDFYRNSGDLLVTIDGLGEIDEVFERITSAIA